MSLEDTLDHMLWLGEQETALRRVKTTDEILKEINQVGIDDLLRVAKGIFRSSSLSLAVIGPQKDKEQAKITGLL
jgi:predicted Zn-dependent peptidase